MATITIAWNDGTADKITVSYTGTAGTSTMQISSDANRTVKERSKVLTVNNNGKTATLTVTQKPRSRAYSVAYSGGYK